MNLSDLLGIISGIIALIAYGLYFHQMRNSQSTPNPSSWLIWLILGIINSFTYFTVTNNNFSQSLVVFAVTLSTLIIFLYALKEEKFTAPSHLDVFIFLCALIIGIFWQTTHNARISNLFLQIIYFISMFPTIAGILKGTGKEHYISWLVVVFAYCFTLASLLLDPSVDWIALVYPLVNGFLGNGVVLAVILFKNKQREDISR